MFGNILCVYYNVQPTTEVHCVIVEMLGVTADTA